MTKKSKLIVFSVLAVVTLLVAGVVGTQVFASSGSTSTTSSSKAASPDTVLADKVASILGLDATTVENAFTQARKEIKAEALDNRLNELVDSGKITQEQADAYKEWIESKPDVNIPGLDGGMGFGQGGHMGGPGKGGFNPEGRLPPGSSGDSSTSGDSE